MKGWNAKDKNQFFLKTSFPGCLESCVAQGISGGGVRGGGDCFCFAEIPNEDKLLFVDEDQCREPCKGDPAFFCGGTTALHIYIASEWVGEAVSNFSDQRVRLGGSDLGTAVTRRQAQERARPRRLKTFVWCRTPIFSCLSLSKSGIGSLKFSSE